MLAAFGALLGPDWSETVVAMSVLLRVHSYFSVPHREDCNTNRGDFLIPGHIIFAPGEIMNRFVSQDAERRNEHLAAPSYQSAAPR
jgi:hypothetical protein